MSYSLSKFKPLNNRILLKKDEKLDADRQETASGILVINSQKPKSRECVATVIKVGTHMYDKYGNRIELSSLFKEGDRVLYYNPAGDVEVELDGEKYLLVRAEDIDCKVEEG